MKPLTLNINENVSIGSVLGKGNKYLGMVRYPISDVNDIITNNLNKRLGSIKKIYAWLEVDDIK